MVKSAHVVTVVRTTETVLVPVPKERMFGTTNRSDFGSSVVNVAIRSATAESPSPNRNPISSDCPLRLFGRRFIFELNVLYVI
jgi:hypothetical protein